MIIIGYQGIGKSTLCEKNDNFIDFDSSNFSKDREHNKNWFIDYAKAAVKLSKEGKNVFVSCHNQVRDTLYKLEEPIVIIYPSLFLRDEWVNKVKQRYDESGLDKDYRAYIRACESYRNDIFGIMKDCEEHNLNFIEIRDMNYNLKKFLF